MLGELDELRETVVESGDLTVELPDGFSAEVVGDYATTRQGGRVSCAVGSLPSGGRRTVVFKLRGGKGMAGGPASADRECG